MTRKDYELIAESVHRSLTVQDIGKRTEKEITAGRRGVRLVAIDLAASLAHHNPLFDRARFLAACGVEVQS